MSTATWENALAELEGNDDNVAHITGRVEHFLDYLGIKIPRALCGVLLVAGPAGPDPGPSAPICPLCAELAGWARA